MSEILLVIPVLGRPQRAQPLYDSASQATDVPHRILFMCSPGDLMQQRACAKTGAEVELVPWEAGSGDWARKIGLAIRISAEPWIFTGADDLRFHHGWASEALRVAAATEARVIGTNDQGNPRVKAGKHSTHSLVHRSYVEECGTVDGPGLFHEDYFHNFSDTEMVETAKSRCEWAFAARSIVEHEHPDWGKGQDDATYALGRRNFAHDRVLYQRRQKLWA